MSQLTENLTESEKKYLEKLGNKGVGMEESFKKLSSLKKMQSRGKNVLNDSSFWDRFKGNARSSLESVVGPAGADIVTGAAKSGLETMRGISSLGERGARALAPAGAEKFLFGEAQDKTAAEQLIPESAITPTNLGEKIGKNVTDVLQFMVPASSVAKGVKLIEGSSALASLPKKLQPVAKLLGISGLEGASFGGVEALQEGEINENVVGASLLGASLPAFGATGKAAMSSKRMQSILKKVDDFLQQEMPSRLINSLVKPISKEFEFGRNAGAGVVKEGITANTRGGLLEKITTKKHELGKEIGAKLKNVKDPIDITPVLNSIDNEIGKAVADRGEEALVKRLVTIRNTITTKFKLKMINGEAKLIGAGKRKLSLTPSEAHELKRRIGEATKWTGQAFDNEANQARVKMYRTLNDLIDSAVPGTKALQARFADIMSAERALERTINIKSRQNIVGLKELLAGLGVGAGAGIVPGVAAALTSKALGSSAVKTRSAQLPGMIKGVVKGAEVSPATVGRGTVAAMADVSTEEQ